MVDSESTFTSGSTDLPNSTTPVVLVSAKVGLRPLVESYKIDMGSHSEVVIEFYLPGGGTVEIDRLRTGEDPIRVTGELHLGISGYGVQGKVVTVNGTTVAKVHVSGRFLGV